MDATDKLLEAHQRVQVKLEKASIECQNLEVANQHLQHEVSNSKQKIDYLSRNLELHH